VLGLPQEQPPPVAIGGHGTDTGPDRATLDIGDGEIGALAVVGVEFVQGNGPRGRRHMGSKPLQRALVGDGQDGGNGRQADAPLRQDAEAGLTVRVAGMGTPHTQDLSLQRRGDRRRIGGGEGLGQGRFRLGAPGIQGGARYPALPAEPRYDAIFSAMREHGGSPLRPLVGRARMAVNHRVPPG